jgi:hypothetical protein
VSTTERSSFRYTICPCPYLTTTAEDKTEEPATEAKAE